MSARKFWIGLGVLIAVQIGVGIGIIWAIHTQHNDLFDIDWNKPELKKIRDEMIESDKRMDKSREERLERIKGGWVPDPNNERWARALDPKYDAIRREQLHETE